MNEESPEKYRKWVTDNSAQKIEEQLFDIYKEALYENQTDAGRISKTIAKAATLMARLSADQEKIAVRMENHTIAIRRLTVGLYWFTAVLIGIGLLQIVVSLSN